MTLALLICIDIYVNLNKQSHATLSVLPMLKYYTSKLKDNTVCGETVLQ